MDVGFEQARRLKVLLFFTPQSLRCAPFSSDSPLNFYQVMVPHLWNTSSDAVYTLWLPACCLRCLCVFWLRHLWYLWLMTESISSRSDVVPWWHPPQSEDFPELHTFVVTFSGLSWILHTFISVENFPLKLYFTLRFSFSTISVLSRGYSCLLQTYYIRSCFQMHCL